MNSVLLLSIYTIVGAIIAYFLDIYINKDLKRNGKDILVCIIGGLSYLLIYLKYGFSVYSILLCVLTSVLILIAVYDYFSHEVCDAHLIICGLISLIIFIYNVFVLKKYFFDYIFSLIMSILFFVAVMFIGKLIYKKEALGLGDVYLAGAIAIVYQPFVMIVSILIASLSGSIIEIIKIKSNKTNKDMEIAFCPYLSFGFYMGLLFAQEIMNIL